LLTQQLHCPGGFTQLFAQAANLTVTAIERLLFHRLLAGVEKRLTPRRNTGGGDPARTWQQIERFPAQQT
jgi:hypothetical protein